MRSEIERRNSTAATEKEEEFDLRDDGRLGKRGRSMLALFPWVGVGDLGLDSSTHRDRVIDGIKGFCIHPQNRWYRVWEKLIILWAVYSSFFTPMEFGFFRGLPDHLYLLDVFSQAAFFIDIFLQFFVAYRDSQTYKIVVNRQLIALRYLKSHFIFDLLACMPWDIIYSASGSKEEVRYLLLIRLVRARKVLDFFSKLEKDIRVNYLFSRIVKLIVVELYCTHTAACIFYYLATTLPAAKEEYTWIGSLKLGDYSYSSFRDIDLWKRYITSLYFAIVTMATVGYGDIHAVNLREMIFVMVYVSFDMILGAYLVGNMTALIVKGSKTERYRDRMTDLLKYMEKNRLGRDIRNQIKGHVRLQYDSSYTDNAVIQDLPISIRAQISEALYKTYIEKVSLFRGCSSEFINHVVTRVHEEFFLPGEVIMEQGVVADQLYFICLGKLEEVVKCEDGSEETVALKPHDSFGDVSILCNIPQPYMIRVCDLCRLLRLDKQTFSNILEIYFHDGRKILNNLLEDKKNDARMKNMVTDISLHIEMEESEIALRVNSAANNGDLSQLKSLIRSGADPNKADYDGRSPLHLAASKGHEDITLFLIENGVEVNITDNFGNTPLFEAIKKGHDKVASLLVNKGGLLKIKDAGSFLCSCVVRGDIDFIRRIIANGVDPNSKDYDFRTPLHVATSQGSYLIAKLLVEAGASVLLKDRWGNTPLDEARLSGNKILIKLLEEAKSLQLSEYPSCSQEPTTDKTPRKKCTIYPFQPQEAKHQIKFGIVLWVPESIDELMKTAADHLKIDLSPTSCIITEDSGKVLDVDFITDGQKLYLITTQA